MKHWKLWIALVASIFFATLAIEPIYLTHCQIDQGGKEYCTSENFLLFGVGQILKVANDWGVLITAFATIAIALFTYILRNSTDKLWVEAKKSSDIAAQSADAATRAAQAAEKANEIAKESLTIDTRPWIGIDAFTVGALSAGSEPPVKISIKNSGRSPAIKLAVRYQSFIQLSSILPPPIPPIRPTDEGMKTLFPGVTVDVFPLHSHILTAPEFTGISSGTHVLWVVLRIEYLDPLNARFTTDRSFYEPGKHAFTSHESHIT